MLDTKTYTRKFRYSNINMVLFNEIFYSSGALKSMLIGLN